MLAMLFSLLALPALAGDAVACAGADCPAEAALRAALNEAGLATIDGLSLHRDATGALWVTLLSTDAIGLGRIGPRSGAVTEPIRGTRSYTRTVPLALTGIDTVPVGSTAGSVDAFLEIDGIEGDDGGGGGGGSQCVEVCVCTESGPECWVEC